MIKPHCNPLNTRLRAHLGLVVPVGPVITIAGVKRQWHEGGLMVFDARRPANPIAASFSIYLCELERSYCLLNLGLSGFFRALSPAHRSV